MANLSNINNKFLVTTGGNILIGQTAAVGSSIFQVTGNSTFAGNVGIGVTSPGHKLDVTTSDSSTWAVALKNTNANGYGLFVQGSEPS